MTVSIGAFEDIERAILSAGLEKVAEIKRDIQQKLKDVGMGCAPHPDSPESAMQHWYLYLDALCDFRLGACRWTATYGEKPEVAVVSTAELDFFADWYDVASAVARSINQRQKDGRGGCNEAKADALRNFMCDHAIEIEKLYASGSRYARYLKDRADQLMRMIICNNFFSVDKIDAFCSKYL